MKIRASIFLVPFIVLMLQTTADNAKIASLSEAIESKHDVWGEAAMQQPNGASYEFFENLLPPLRYVNADFRFYPIVLSAPNAKTKARLISNGSGVNLRGGARSWNDVGVPVTFRVGPDEFCFGGILNRVSHPTLAEGCLPIVEIKYLHPFPVQSEGGVPLNQTPANRVPETYRLEAFACVEPAYAENAIVLVKFSLAEGKDGIITADVEVPKPMKFADGKITNAAGEILALFDKNWKLERGMAHAKLTTGKSVTLAIPTKPLDETNHFNFSDTTYDEQRALAVKTWQEILAGGMNVEVPEPRVQNAWRNLLLQNFTLLHDDRIFYSAGNQYEKLYEAEGSDAAVAMMEWGYEAEMRKMILPLLQFTRQGLEFHHTGLKLNDISSYYWQTRDAEFVRSLQKYWEKEVGLIVNSRTNEFGLLPKERYCGDISTPVFSLNSSAKAWRGLRDFAVVLREIGETEKAIAYEKIAAEFRPRVLDAIKKSARRETSPPFVPLALHSEEAVHDPITKVRIGSYWNIVIGYVIGSGIFPPGSEQETWIPHYQEQHGGLCMGMLRAGGAMFGFWSGAERVNPLYGTRYAIDALRRDDVERTLVSFYGMLAQGFTRNTLVAGEGSALAPVDEGGRIFYCPPNSAGNAHFLAMLRHLLVQDFDLDDDGKPEMLRLCFATPKRWLEDGKQIKVERAPTAFGPVSFNIQSKLNQGEVIAEIDPPHRNSPKHLLFRVRVPDGWKIISANSGAKSFPVDEKGTIDLSKSAEKLTVHFKVARK